MNSKQLCAFRADLRREGIIFAYCGYVSEDVLSGVGDAVRKKLAIEEASVATIRNVFAVFVEQIQNIIRYSAERLDSDDSDEKVSYGVLTIGERDGTYFVQAGNAIAEGQVARLRDQLERLRDMDKAQIKSAYKDQLKSERPAGALGAGIGLIEIARRATLPLEFDFHDIGDGYSFFAIEARI